MTADKLRKAAIELFGSRGWTTDLADRLGVHRTTVYRYVQGQLPIPGPVAAAVDSWLSELRANRRHSAH